jgi:Tat protein translocase TatB subunit
MPSLGPLELLVIAIVALIVFGPERLPDIAKRIGRTASQMRRMAADVQDEFRSGFDTDDPDEPDEVDDRRRPPRSRATPREPRPGAPAARSSEGSASPRGDAPEAEAE